MEQLLPDFPGTIRNENDAHHVIETAEKLFPSQEDDKCLVCAYISDEDT